MAKRARELAVKEKRERKRLKKEQRAEDAANGIVPEWVDENGTEANGTEPAEHEPDDEQQTS